MRPRNTFTTKKEHNLFVPLTMKLCLSALLTAGRAMVQIPPVNKHTATIRIGSVGDEL